MTPEQLTEQTIATFAAWRENPNTPIQATTNQGKTWWDIDSPQWTSHQHYRIKPFELGREVNGHVLGDGEQWHRVDEWTAQDLAGGWRPAVLGESLEPEEDFEYGFTGSFSKGRSNPTAQALTMHTRTKRPLPSALKPKFRDWNCAEDVPMPICWLQSGGEKDRMYQVNHVCSKGVWTPNGAGNQLWPWARIAERGHNAVYHSTDGKTWQPCKVEVK